MKPFILIFILLFFYKVESFAFEESGRIVLLIQQGHHREALDLYTQHYKEGEGHDYELLHRIGLEILNQGFSSNDPEIQLLALFGAGVSAHQDAYPILEGSLRSAHPQIQLVAIHSLATAQHDDADKALNLVMGSRNPIVRLEAVNQLCLKKHPNAVAQTESLMAKMPKQILPLFPQLYAMVGDQQSIRLLRRLLADPSEKVRLAAILSVARYGRDDFLPQLRQLSLQLHFSQQEAAASALGILKDDRSVAQLQRMARSQYPTVSLAASQALHRLGKEEALVSVQQAATKGDLFAIHVLGELPGAEQTLAVLAKDPDLQVRINAAIALLKRGQSSCLPGLKEILIKDRRDLVFIETHSPGGAFTSWKALSSGSQVLSEDVAAYVADLQFKEGILEKAKQGLPEADFLTLAALILATGQNEIVPTTIALLEELETEQAINVLKTYQQKIGAPLVRHYCNLALYRLKEEGPYGESLRQWVRGQFGEALIRFLPVIPWQEREGSVRFALTPEEVSGLLVKAFEAFASQQDEAGIELLLEAIRDGNAKNKYALAGLLLRATQ